jgi:cytoskeletal protein RodZ
MNDLSENIEDILSPEFIEKIKAERKRRGISVEQISRDTNIRAVYINAIESGNLASLPGGVYTKSYVRTISEYLGINSKLADQIKDVERKKQAEVEISMAEINQIRDSSNPGFIVILGAICAVVVLLIVYNYSSAPSNIEPAKITEADEKKLDENGITITVPTEGGEATATATVSDQPTPIDVAKQSEEAAKENANVISIVATGIVNVLVTDPSGAKVANVDLQFGDTYFLPKNDGLIITPSNVNNIEVYIDGNYVENIASLTKMNGGYLIESSKLIKAVVN